MSIQRLLSDCLKELLTIFCLKCENSDNQFFLILPLKTQSIHKSPFRRHLNYQNSIQQSQFQRVHRHVSVEQMGCWGLIILKYLNSMNDYGNSTSRGRAVLKSPNPHLAQDTKLLKKKYEQAKDALRAQKKNSQALEATVKTLKEQTSKQDKELFKKEEQIEILLQQIKYLKNVIAESKSKKSSKEISSYQEVITSKSTHSEEAPSRSGGVVGGYFGSVFN